MNVIYHLSDSHLRDLWQLYQHEWWTNTRSYEETCRCVAGSQLCIGLVDEQDALKGFVRVLTDYTFKALIFDVIVAIDYRNSGLGDRLLALVKEHPSLQAVKSFELYCRSELKPFYQRHGFSDNVGAIYLMRKMNLPPSDKE